MMAMCRHTVQLNCIFDHSDVFLETQTFQGKRKCERKQVFKIRFVSALIVLQPLIALLINVQMQPTFHGGSRH